MSWVQAGQEQHFSLHSWNGLWLVDDAVDRTVQGLPFTNRFVTPELPRSTSDISQRQHDRRLRALIRRFRSAASRPISVGQHLIFGLWRRNQLTYLS